MPRRRDAGQPRPAVHGPLARAEQPGPRRPEPRHGPVRQHVRHRLRRPGRPTGDAYRSDWRTFLGTEPNERFVGFGRPILAPADGEVVVVHDGEPDHEARRSWKALPYLWTQAQRARLGPAAVAGNHVGLALPDGRTFVFLVHLRLGPVGVSVGDVVRAGQVLGTCGNSGNSTQPHVHVQATDDVDITRARGVPITFRDFREELARGRRQVEWAEGVPAEGSVVAPWR